MSFEGKNLSGAADGTRDTSTSYAATLNDDRDLERRYLEKEKFATEAPISPPEESVNGHHLDDSDFPDGGARAWSIVLGVSLRCAIFIFYSNTPSNLTIAGLICEHLSVSFSYGPLIARKCKVLMLGFILLAWRAHSFGYVNSWGVRITTVFFPSPYEVLRSPNALLMLDRCTQAFQAYYETDILTDTSPSTMSVYFFCSLARNTSQNPLLTTLRISTALGLAPSR